MKFDGITSSGDTEVATPKGYGKIEYAYHLMAVEAGIEMTTCRLHHEAGRSHFMTKRFDRSANCELFVRAGDPNHSADGTPSKGHGSAGSARHF